MGSSTLINIANFPIATKFPPKKNTIACTKSIPKELLMFIDKTGFYIQTLKLLATHVLWYVE